MPQRHTQEYLFFSLDYGFELHPQKKYKAKIEKYVMNECISLVIDRVETITVADVMSPVGLWNPHFEALMFAFWTPPC